MRKAASPPSEKLKHLYHLDGLPQPFRDIQNTVHFPGWEMYFHQHAFYQLVFIKSGRASVRTDRAFPVEPGQMVVLLPGLSHTWSNTGADRLEMLNIHINPGSPAHADLERYLQALCRSPRQPGFCPPRLPLIALEDRIAAELRAGDYGYKHRIAALLTEMVIDAVRAGLKARHARAGRASQVSRIEKAVWFIEGNYARPLTLEDISRSISVSPHHCCDLFAAEAGISPMRYLQKVRVDKAQFLLEQSELRVGEIARQVGIEDEHYFSRLFKKITRQTPQQFRADGKD
jgi:AraC-like DNA-binding protein